MKIALSFRVCSPPVNSVTPLTNVVCEFELFSTKQISESQKMHAVLPHIVPY
jgi:hypothetical protein